MSDDFSLSLDHEGYLQVGDELPMMLRMFLEDLSLNIRDCDRVLTAIDDVRAGRRLDYRTTTNVIHVHVLPMGTYFTIAARLDRNMPIPVSTNELEHAVRRLRAFIEALPENLRLG